MQATLNTATLPPDIAQDATFVRLYGVCAPFTMTSVEHELEHLYPRLSQGGLLVLDDYGHWLGARQAVDEFFAHHPAPPLLHRIDYTGRIGLKVS
jgi:hypothetical protein